MNLFPILKALRRNQAGALLIALQIALTLAIVCNALFIIQQRLTHLSRPSGMQEANLFSFGNLWIGSPDTLAARQSTDLAALRALPNVVDAYATNSLPLSNGGSTSNIGITPPGDGKPSRHTAKYFADEHTLTTLGLKIAAGRNFDPDEVVRQSDLEGEEPKSVIVTQALADALFPAGDALGKSVYVGDTKTPSTVVGIVERMVVPWTNSWGDRFSEYSTLMPVRYISHRVSFVVRAKPGQLDVAVKDAAAKLFELDHNRVINNTLSMSDMRAKSYRSDRGMAIMMGVVCVALLLVTAAGIVGLASFWVGQRHRQIGIRRALGARKLDIMRYFQIENLLITTAGAVIGSGLALGLNLWLIAHFEMRTLSTFYVSIAALLLILLGQLAVLSPALRASRVPPVVATRSV